MNFINHPTFLLRLALSMIMAMHCIPTMLDGSINGFGTEYLDKVGFAPFGLFLAWAVKLTHLIAIPLLLFNRYVMPVAIANILILIVGIFMVHLENGWYVVGGGRNGIEFNFLLIFSFLTLMFPHGLKRGNPLK
ncbi:MAG: DoxX family protein [Saprospiraceae bacterium]|nr:DoxX family protein [Saprospiraceae bacterium]